MPRFHAQKMGSEEITGKGSTRDKILMCPPHYFTVDYVINPWMAGHESSLDIELAKTQWQVLRDAIGEVAEVAIIDPQPDLPDLVFTANAGAVYGEKAIASHFMPHERIVVDTADANISPVTP